MTKNIIIVAPTLPPQPSGAGKRAARHAIWLSRNGHGITVITGTHTDVFKDTNICVEHILKKNNNSKYNNSIVRFIKNIFIVKKILKNKKYENPIIHCFGTGQTAWIILFWAKWYGLKMITELTLLGSDDPSNKDSGVIKPYIIPWILRKSDAVIGISPALIDSAREIINDHTRLYLIPNDIKVSDNLDTNNRDEIKSKLGLSGYNKVILFVGGFILRKGVDILVPSFLRYSKYNPDSVLVIVGLHKNPVHMKAKKRTLSILNMSEFPENIKFAGYKTNVTDYYLISDLLLFPSRREGFPNSVVEAMAMKIPVVARKIPGITDYIIDNGINGVLIDSDDPEKYASAMINILDDRTLREKMTDNAQVKVKKCFSQEVIMQQYLNVYKTVNK